MKPRIDANLKSFVTIRPFFDRFVLSQVLGLIHRHTLDRIIKRYEPTISARNSGFRQQPTCMVFAQMTSRDGLRDIVNFFDEFVINGLLVGGLSRATASTGNLFRQLQSGSLQAYSFAFGLGVILVIYFTVFLQS